jgi:hypothetical protein
MTPLSGHSAVSRHAGERVLVHATRRLSRKKANSDQASTTARPGPSARTDSPSTRKNERRQARQETRHSPNGPKPFFDTERHILWYNGQIVKQFKGPATSQILILTAFQELGWPPRIDHPLPRVAGKNPKARLHDAINRLKGNQRNRLLTFRGDGTGQGIMWEALA